MSGVGLTCDGRGSSYDIIFNYETKMLYTIDRKDDTYTCEVKCELQN